MDTPFEAFLKQHDSRAWAAVRTSLSSSIHEVHRNAVEIWLHFFPLPLADAFARSENPAQLTQDLRLDGNWRLAVIRLACMALGSGNVSIVIPPWNGFIGKAALGT